LRKFHSRTCPCCGACTCTHVHLLLPRTCASYVDIAFSSLYWCLQYTLQHTATHCNTLQHTATHCNTLQHSVTHCSTHCNAHILLLLPRPCARYVDISSILVCQLVFTTHNARLCNTLQHTATHCKTLQDTAIHCNTVQYSAIHAYSSSPPTRELRMSMSRFCLSTGVCNINCNTLQHTATHCNTLQHSTTHCNTLQHTTTHCNTLQHTATHYNTLQHTATHAPSLSFACHRHVRVSLYRCLQHALNTLQHTSTHRTKLQLTDPPYASHVKHRIIVSLPVSAISFQHTARHYRIVHCIVVSLLAYATRCSAKQHHYIYVYICIHVHI